MFGTQLGKFINYIVAIITVDGPEPSVKRQQVA